MLFTIGYEGSTIQRVLAALTGAGVTRLIDVRALPLSRKPGFSKRQLAAGLNEAGIGYVHLRDLGTPKAGRDAVRRGDPSTMRVIFAAHMATPHAQAALAEAAGLSRDGGACLLCFERDHTHCHRDIVAGLIGEAGRHSVRHLLAETV